MGQKRERGGLPMNLHELQGGGSSDQVDFEVWNSGIGL